MNQAPTMRKRNRSLFVAVIPLMIGLLASPCVFAETWTSLRGTTSIEADMVGLWGDQLVLSMRDGRRITVALNDLRAESRIQAQRLADSNEESRIARINELRLQADSAASPAPDPLPVPQSAAAYSQPDPAGDAAARFKAVDQQVRAGHLIALFDALPASHQKDLEELARLAATKTSGITWRSLVVSAHQLGDLIVTRQNWFFSHPKFDVSISETPDETQKLNDTILSLAGMLRSGIDLDRFEPSVVQTTPLRDWLLERDTAIAPYLAELFERTSIDLPEFAVEQGKGKAVSLIITTAGIVSPDSTSSDTGSVEPVKRTVPLTKVDEVLVPTSLVESWKTVIPSSKKSWEDSEDGSVMADPTSVVLLSTLGPLINPLGQAQNRNEFHAAMQPLLDVVAPMLEELQTNLTSGR